jgi:hypothetical protein
MRNGFIFMAELTASTPYPSSHQEIMFCRNCIMLDQPQPNFYFKGILLFPQMPEGSINSISTKMVVH